MSTGIISTAVTNVVAAHAEKQTENYTMVNVRPGEKISAMLDVICHLSEKSPSMVVAHNDAFSKQLARYAASRVEHAQAVLDAAGQVISQQKSRDFSASSALGLLSKDGFFVVDPLDF